MVWWNPRVVAAAAVLVLIVFALVNAIASGEPLGWAHHHHHFGEDNWSW